MKRTRLLHCSVTTLLVLGAGLALRAADDPAPPPGLPTREELREKLKGLTPEERQAKLKELREKSGFNGPLAGEMQKKRAELQKFRESIKDLPPAERETKMREWREKNLPLLNAASNMSPEDRATNRVKLQERIKDQLDALKEKKKAGTLTEEETRRLERMETWTKRLDSGEAPLTGKNPPLGLPPPSRAPGEKPAKPEKPADGK